MQPTTFQHRTSFWERYRWPLLGGAALLLGLAVGWLLLGLLEGPYTYHGTVIQPPEPAPNFALTGAGGERRSLDDFRDKAVLIYFGYTYCPDVCPATMVELANAVELLGRDAEQVQVIMISVDPERDTPERLQEYVAHFNPSFVGLTGTEEELASVAALYGIYYQKHEGTVASGYLFDHTASVIGVDPDGDLRVVYPFNTPAKDIAADMRHLLK